MRSFAVVFFLLVASISAFAADVSGAWNITVETPNGPIPAVLTLKQDGDKLTGNVASPMGEIPLSGVVKDSDVTFTMTMDGGGGPMVLSYKAKVDGDKISGSVEIAGQGEIKFSGTKKP